MGTPGLLGRASKRVTKMVDGIRWTVQDRNGNEVYLTQERWQHISEPGNHPEMAAHSEDLRQTVRQGTRTQDRLNPQKYRYAKALDGLPGENTHIVAIVLFRFRQIDDGEMVPNNFIVTAYQKAMRW